MPVRMKCEVTDVPVKAVKYEYKGNDYSLSVYGNDSQVWVDGKQPAEFTWKVATVLVIVLAIVLWIALPDDLRRGAEACKCHSPFINIKTQTATSISNMRTIFAHG